MRNAATASQLWAKAAGVAPTGVPSPKNDQCVMCGATVSAGELAQSAQDKMNESFNNKVDCKHSGKSVCGCCDALWQNTWLQRNSKSYAVDGEGVFRLASGDDIASFVLKPPTHDYVAIFNTRQQGHLIWRTPVSAPSNWLMVRIDDALITIDRERVIKAAQAYRAGLEMLAAIGQPKAVLALFSPTLASVNAGKIIKKYAAMIEGQGDEGKEIIRTLRGLTMGDWWALTAVRHADTTKPETWPERRAIEDGESQ